MRESTRLYATLIIWVAFTITTALILTADSGLVSRIETYEAIPILGVLAGAATLSTWAIWIAAGRGSTPEAVSDADAKRKRRTRLERLVDTMDDEDLYELEALLAMRDEQPDYQPHTQHHS